MTHDKHVIGRHGRYVLEAKVSDKGALSIYGLGRFPVTLYAEQWEAVLANVQQISDYLEAHRGEFSIK